MFVLLHFFTFWCLCFEICWKATMPHYGRFEPWLIFVTKFLLWKIAHCGHMTPPTSIPYFCLFHLVPMMNAMIWYEANSLKRERFVCFVCNKSSNFLPKNIVLHYSIQTDNSQEAHLSQSWCCDITFLQLYVFMLCADVICPFLYSYLKGLCSCFQIIHKDNAFVIVATLNSSSALLCFYISNLIHQYSQASRLPLH